MGGGVKEGKKRRRSEGKGGDKGRGHDNESVVGGHGESKKKGTREKRTGKKRRTTSAEVQAQK